jgi:hypothetical protein
MNVYFLVEGARTEVQVYPAWLKHLTPDLKPVARLADYTLVTENNYCLISGGGYPRILTNLLPQAVADVNASKRFHYLVICIDADEVSADERRLEVQEHLSRNPIFQPTEPVTLIQNRCIETWLLGNRRVFPRNPQHEKLRGYIEHYNVSRNDPELMEKPTAYPRSIGSFHTSYLEAIFQERTITYSKNDARHVQERSYLDRLRERIVETPNHLGTFQAFIEFCRQVNPNLPEIIAS